MVTGIFRKLSDAISNRRLVRDNGLILGNVNAQASAEPTLTPPMTQQTPGFLPVLMEASTAAGDLQKSAVRMAVLAAEVGEKIGSASSSAADTAGATSLAATGAARISATFAELSATFGEVTRAANATRDEVAESVIVFGGLKSSAKTVENVLTVIDQIAMQNNLLSLNALIEAAHAGSAGRGFSIVAAEVKRLAVNTKTATSDIRALMVNLLKEIDTSVTKMSVLAQQTELLMQHANSAGDRLENDRATAGQIVAAIQEAAIMTERTASEVAAAGDRAMTVGMLAEEVLSTTEVQTQRIERAVSVHQANALASEPAT